MPYIINISQKQSLSTFLNDVLQFGFLMLFQINGEENRKK